MKKRSRTEMLATMLEVAKGKATKTKIKYSTFLSYNQLKEFLSILTKNNLLDHLEGTHQFKTTRRGLNVLTMYREMAELLQTIDKKMILFDC
jgi:predicted transcriptional regulator